MWVKILIVFALLFAFTDGGEKEGRRGNKLYERGQYAEAAGQYRAGLEVADPADGRAYFGLLHNLGSSLYRMEDYENAKKVLDQAMQAAGSEQDFSRAAYNAGNTAVQMQDLQNAVNYYRNALLADPDNEDAKFNYEFAKRRLEEQQQQQQQQGGSSNNDQQNRENQQNQGQNPNEQNNDQNQEDEQQQNEQENNQQSGDQNQEEERDAPEPQANEDREQMSRQEAERILQALQNEEEDLLREAQRLKSPPRRVEKDW